MFQELFRDRFETLRLERTMRRTPRIEETHAGRERAPLRTPAWMPAHNPIPSAAPLFKRCRRNESWGNLIAQPR
jgi:hypothetical protein